MVVGPVRTTGEVDGPLEAAVHEHLDVLQPHRPHEAGLGASEGLGLLQGHQLQLCRAGEVLHLHGIDLVVAPEDRPHELRAALGEGGPVEEELAGLREGHALGMIGVDHARGLLHLAHHAGGAEMVPLQLKGRSVVAGGQRGRLRLLDVGGVLAAVAAEDGVLATAGQHVELVGEAAADGAAVGLHGAELDAEAGEDPLVGVEHGPVFTVGVGIIHVEGVAVLHGELAAPHEAETRAPLVAELGLDLEEVHGQLLVAAHVLAHDVGDDLLVRGAQAEVVELALVRRLAPLAPFRELGLGLPVAEPQQLVAVELPAPALLPQLRRQHRGHEQFLAAVLGQLLADDLLELADAAVGQGQVAVDAGRGLLDHASPHHELLAHHVGIPGGLPEGLDQELRLLHQGPRTFESISGRGDRLLAPLTKSPLRPPCADQAEPGPRIRDQGWGHPSRPCTRALAAFPSKAPPWAAWRAFITAPMSFFEAAPVWAMAALTAVSRSAPSSMAGR